MEERTTCYIDANVFIYAAVDDSEKGAWCLDFLRRVHEGKIIGFTSCLTFDEFLWMIRKIQPDQIGEAGAGFLFSALIPEEQNALCLTPGQ